MARKTWILILFVFGGCATSPTVHNAYVWPTNGQRDEQTAQDKAECYRVSQGIGDTIPEASTGTGIALVTDGFAGGAAAYEEELARRYPPDLSKYGACLTARGYSVEWPGGAQP